MDEIKPDKNEGNNPAIQQVIINNEEIDELKNQSCNCKGGMCRQLYCVCLKKGVACKPGVCQCVGC